MRHLLALAVALLLGSSLNAAPAAQFQYSGLLLDSSNMPVTSGGPYSFHLSVWDGANCYLFGRDYTTVSPDSAGHFVLDVSDSTSANVINVGSMNNTLASSMQSGTNPNCFTAAGNASANVVGTNRILEIKIWNPATTSWEQVDSQPIVPVHESLAAQSMVGAIPNGASTANMLYATNNSGTGNEFKSIQNGSGISVTNGAGQITIATNLTAADVPNLDASKITTGTLALTQVPSLPATQITTGTLAAAQIPNLDASKITTGSFATARIPSLDAGIITSGVFNTAQIPGLDASQITSGSFALARIPTLDATRIPSLDASKITSGVLSTSVGGTGLVPTVGDANRVYGINTAGTGSEFKSIVGGSGITVTPSSGTITISSAGGSVTNVGMTGNAMFSISPSSISTFGTFNLDWQAVGSAGQVLASPAGAGGAPAFRSLVATDIPSLGASKITSGVLTPAVGGTGLAPAAADANKFYAVNAAGTGTEFKSILPGSGINVDTSVAGQVTISSSLAGGTVTSVSMTGNPVFQITGSPVTGNGTFNIDWANVATGNLVWASPNGASGPPAFRALDAADIQSGTFSASRIPNLDAAKITTGTLAAAVGGTGLVPQAANSNQVYGVNSAGTGAEFKTLVQGTGVTITNSAGQITIAAAGSGGTVTNVGLSMPTGFSVSPASISSAGTFAVTLSGGTFATSLLGTLPTTNLAGTLSSAQIGIVPAANGGTGLDGSSAANGKILIGNGSGYTLATLQISNGISQSLGAGAITLTTNATNLNTGSTLVERDPSGNFSAGAVDMATVGIRGSTTGTVTMKAPASFTDYSLMWPGSVGSPGQVLTTDGVNSLSWTTPSTGVTSMSDGTEAAPGWAFTNKINTGIYRPGGATLAISTNGTEALRVDSSGFVGIGTKAPGGNLDITTTSTSNTPLLINTPAGFAGNYVQYLQGGTVRYQVNSQGQTQGTPGSAGAPGYTFLNHTDLGMFYAGTGSLGFSTSSTERLRIDSAGNVGIGTMAPTKNLSFNGNVAQIVGMENSTAAANGNSLTLQAGGAGTGSNRNGGDLILSSGAASGNGSGGIQFKTVTSNQGTGSTVRNPTTKMTITGDGLVGIGTTTPSTPLDVLYSDSAGWFAGLTVENSSSSGSAVAAIDVMNDVGNFTRIGSFASTAAPPTAPGIPRGMSAIQSSTGMLFHTDGYTTGGTSSMYFITGGLQNNPTLTITGGNTGSVGIGTISPKALLDVNGTMRVTQICDSSGGNCKTISSGWGAGGSVTNVGLSGSSMFSITNSPVTTAGTINIDWANVSTGNQVLASPDGAGGPPAFRALSANDIPNLDAAKITSGTFATARLGTIPASNLSGTLATAVIGNISASQVTSGTFATARLGSVDASIVTTGTLATARLGNVDASIVTTGTFATARLGTIPTSILSGTLATAAVGNISASQVTSGTFAAARLGVVPTANGGTGLATAPTSGQILVGNSGSGYTLGTIAGSNGIVPTSSSGLVTISTNGNSTNVASTLVMRDTTGYAQFGSIGINTAGNSINLVNTGVGYTLKLPTSMGTPGQVLSSNGTDATSWVSAPVNGGQFLAGSGTTNAPGFAFSSDSDTGIWNPTANNLAISTGGVEALRIDSSGKVGIGITNPGAPLHVAAGATSIAAIFESNTTASPGTQVIINDTNGSPESDLVFQTNGVNRYVLVANATNQFGIWDASTERLHIEPSGEVGINTNNSVANSSLSVVPMTTSGVGLTVTQLNNSQTADLQRWTKSSGVPLSVMNAGGSLGLGVTAPSARLDVNGGARFDSVSIIGTGTTAILAPTSGTFALRLPNTSGSPGNVLSTNGAGILSWVAPGAGTVTNVGLSGNAMFSITNSPVTGAGTINLDWMSQSANQILASPDSASGAPVFRSLVANDIPNLDAGKITSGTLATARLGTIPSSAIGSITASQVSGGTFATTLLGNVDASIVTTGTFATARLGTLDAGKIATGTFATARLGAVDASFVATGTFATARLGTIPSSAIGSITASQVSGGTFATTLLGNVDASIVTTGTFATARLGTLPAANLSGTLATARLGSLDASIVTSGTFATARLGTLSTANLSGTLASAQLGIVPAANGGTGLDGSAAAAGYLMIGNGAGFSLATLGVTNGLTQSLTSGHIALSTNAQTSNTVNTLVIRDGSGAFSAGTVTLSGAALNGGGGLVTLTAPAGATAYTFKVPGTAGSSGQVLSTDGSGNMSWTTAPANGGTFLAANGSSATPGFAFNSNTSTGLFLIGAGTLGFSAGGSEKMRLDSGGNLQLGGTSPSAGGRFTARVPGGNSVGVRIESSGGNPTHQFTVDASNNGVMDVYDSSVGKKIEFAASGNSYISNTNGSFGVGTATPTEKMEVNGNMKVGGQLYAPTSNTTGVTGTTYSLTFTSNVQTITTSGSSSSLTVNVNGLVDGGSYLLVIKNSSSVGQTYTIAGCPTAVIANPGPFPTSAIPTNGYALFNIIHTSSFGCFVTWSQY